MYRLYSDIEVRSGLMNVEKENSDTNSSYADSNLANLAGSLIFLRLLNEVMRVMKFSEVVS